jgi:hypothetical protein
MSRGCQHAALASNRDTLDPDDSVRGSEKHGTGSSLTRARDNFGPSLCGSREAFERLLLRHIGATRAATCINLGEDLALCIDRARRRHHLRAPAATFDQLPAPRQHFDTALHGFDGDGQSGIERGLEDVRPRERRFALLEVAKR